MGFIVRRFYYGTETDQKQYVKHDSAVFHTVHHCHVAYVMDHRCGRIFYGKLCGEGGDRSREPGATHRVSVPGRGADGIHRRGGDCRNGPWSR